MDRSTRTINCACVIYGDAYDWHYVDVLYAMLDRHLTGQVKLHVYTEDSRPVPNHMIKHVLEQWPEIRSGRAWWYKMQLFNPAHYSGPLLYFDLDTVIVNNIDWIVDTPLTYFNTVRDFQYLWSPTRAGVNSSVMWWDTTQWSWVWDKFCSESRQQMQLKHRGDQDFITETIRSNQRRYFAQERVRSWRWQCLDGGYDFQKRRHRTPSTGTNFSNETSVLVFHGSPKPSEVQDPVILQHWTV